MSIGQNVTSAMRWSFIVEALADYGWIRVV